MRLDGPVGGAHAAHVQNHAIEGMKGLVVGITVTPGRSRYRWPAHALAPRRLRLLLRPSAEATERAPVYRMTLEEGGAELRRPGARAGPPLVLTRDVPVAIMVVNGTLEPTAIHWHGIELDSYFDGVAGFSGDAKRPSPLIAAGDSFEARFTPPRVGRSFYHTHVDELRQQPAGCPARSLSSSPAGAMTRRRHPGADHAPRDSADEAQTVFINGRRTPAPLDGPGRRCRTACGSSTSRSGAPRSAWRFAGHDTAVVAPAGQDGGELPAARPTRAPGAPGHQHRGGRTTSSSRPAAAGEYRLEVRKGSGSVLAVMLLRAS